MPRDKRLFMTWANDFWLHPKIAPLTDAAFRAFVEMTGYSRMHDLDGRLPAAVVNRMWGAAVDELLTNHPQRPSLSHDGVNYVLWNYEEHQETRASRAERSAVNTANGKLGGRPRKNPPKTDSVTNQEPKRFANPAESKPNQNQSNTETKAESRVQRDLTTFPESSPEVDARVSTDSPLSPVMKKLAAQAGVASDLPVIREEIRARCTRTLDRDRTVVVARWLLDKSPDEVHAPAAYVLGAIRRSPLEVQKHIDDNGLAS